MAYYGLTMKKALIIIVCVFFWNCTNCGHSKSYYKIVEKESKIVKFDSSFVKDAYITGGRIDMNQDGISERYFESVNVYLDSNKYGNTFPRKVIGSFFRGQDEVIIDSMNIHIRETIFGVGIFVRQKIIGNETRLKLVLYNEESKPLILEFNIEQHSWKTTRSHCLDEYLLL